MRDADTRVIHRPRRAWPARARTAAAPIAALVAMLGLAACGNSPGNHLAHLDATATRSSPASLGSGGSSNAAGSTNAQSANSQPLAFSRCMRSQGVANFPDPNSSGVFPKPQVEQAADNPQYPAAARACGHLLPNGGPGVQPSQAALQQSWSDMANFAQCMRSHGVPDWPEPTRYPQHPERPTFNLSTVGIDLNSPGISTKIHACLYLLNGNNPQHLGGS